jgi:hypothetical protein
LEVRRRVRRMPLKEAAAVLGISKDAVRQRVRRDTLQADKGEDGRVYVYLDASVDDVHAAKPPPASEAAGDDPLHQQMQARIDDLREQLHREQDAHAEARRVILALTSRIPQLEAPSEGRESDLSADAGSGRGDVPREALEVEREVRERAEEKAAALEGELRALRELQVLRPPLKLPETVKGEPESAEPQSATGDSQTAPKRPWWRRVFGG